MVEDSTGLTRFTTRPNVATWCGRKKRCRLTFSENGQVGGTFWPCRHCLPCRTRKSGPSSRSAYSILNHVMYGTCLSLLDRFTVKRKSSNRKSQREFQWDHPSTVRKPSVLILFSSGIAHTVRVKYILNHSNSPIRAHFNFCYALL